MKTSEIVNRDLPRLLKYASKKLGVSLSKWKKDPNNKSSVICKLDKEISSLTNFAKKADFDDEITSYVRIRYMIGKPEYESYENEFMWTWVYWKTFIYG